MNKTNSDILPSYDYDSIWGWNINQNSKWDLQIALQCKFTVTLTPKESMLTTISITRHDQQRILEQHIVSLYFYKVYIILLKDFMLTFTLSNYWLSVLIKSYRMVFLQGKKEEDPPPPPPPPPNSMVFLHLQEVKKKKKKREEKKREQKQQNFRGTLNSADYKNSQAFMLLVYKHCILLTAIKISVHSPVWNCLHTTQCFAAACSFYKPHGNWEWE